MLTITFSPDSPEDWARVMALGAAVGVRAVEDDDDESTDNDGPAPTVDSHGTPWLADFHAPAKSRNKDGTWRRKKGLSAAEKDAAERAEMAARVSVGTPAAALDTPPPGGYLPPAGTGAAQVVPAGIPSPLTPAANPALVPVAAPVLTVAPVDAATVYAKIHTIQEKFPGALTGEIWGDLMLRSFGTTDNGAIQTNEAGRAALTAELFNRFGV